MSEDGNGGWKFTFFTFLDGEAFSALALIGILLLVAPIIALVLFLDRVCTLIVNHVLVFITVIVALATIVGLIGYKISSAKHKILGVAASALNVVPGMLVMIFYSIPYVIEKPGIGSWFDFIATLVLMLFVEVLIAGFAMDKENGAKHFLVSAIAILITVILLNVRITAPEIIKLYKIP